MSNLEVYNYKGVSYTLLSKGLIKTGDIDKPCVIYSKFYPNEDGIFVREADDFYAKFQKGLLET